ncbi:DUF2333 family protein [Kangiella koreensis]|uniref:DUF2333 domain-containing protein n=1 Tax=Kangiella koreensis (strain DSM 16069 / JCM 12317 / KCTC 12182 / SW-125) TaxID=523791 RepID=C7R9C2_KANKD|nr:DUF2333 family protein [Kangiella koreensis]ACV26013.1 conserved hypothetical protein [Kangiella koreensis DSM 16069]
MSESNIELDEVTGNGRGRKKWSAVLATIIVLLVLMLVFIFVWSSEPEPVDINTIQQSYSGEAPRGYVTVETTAQIVENLLNKSGGFLSNDIMPPSVFMDNMPAFEFGALVQIRDIAQVLRNDISRSQSQSLEDEALKFAEPAFNIDHRKWMFPRAEREYRKGVKLLREYRDRLADPQDSNTQFYARSDNLRSWLYLVSKRLGGLSQRLSASVGRSRINTDLANDASAEQSTPSSSIVTVTTPWMEIDDVFWEARGATWAQIQLLKAIEKDFAHVLEDKNARTSFQQIIMELEATQEPIWSPMILNGDEFGFFSNHSLVMSSYISRANAATIDLIDLLKGG